MTTEASSYMIHSWRQPNGKLHREYDQPAVICADGRKEWWLHGKRHREGDQPAIVYACGAQEWFLDDKRHREGDKPAIVMADGTQSWWKNDMLHREGDQPAVVQASGSQEWWRSNMPHREGAQPATIRSDGTVEWWVQGSMVHSVRVTDFRETSERFAAVRAFVCAGLAACNLWPATDCARCALLAAVQASRTTKEPEPSHHVDHEYAFLVALFL